MRSCEALETAHFTSFSCLNEPVYLLSRNCTNSYYGAAGPCCKVDDMIHYLVNDRPELFRSIQFVLHSDDDEYWRGDQVLRWLAALFHSGINHLPIVANNDGFRKSERQNGRGVWSWQNCSEILTGGWYQPMMLNRAALKVLARYSKHYGLRQTCKAFDVTHDVGMGPFVWLLGMNHLAIPGLTLTNFGRHVPLSDAWSKRLAVHGVKHYKDEDFCDDELKWPHAERFNQSLVIGCGTMEKRGVCFIYCRNAFNI